GDLAAAERQLVAVSKALPSADAYVWLGLLYEAKHDLAQARAAYKHAHELDPKSRGVLVGLISADLTEKKYDSARMRVESALTEQPKDASLLLMAGNAYMAMGDMP